MACVQSFPPRTPKECRAILNEVDMINPTMALMLEFSARTGLRVGDAGSLKFKELHINGVLRDSITIVQSKPFNKRVTSSVNLLTRKGAVVDSKMLAKITAEARRQSTLTIAISDAAKLVIEDALRLQGGDMSGLVFESSIKKGSAYSTQYINRILKVVAFKLKLNFPLSTHSFRKAFAMFMTDNDAKIHQVRDALGHSSIAVTDAYLKTFMTEYEEIAAKVDF